MAKYDWIALKKEYILSDYTSVSAFLKSKSININGSTKKSTKGWKDEKVLKQDQKATKIVEKVIEQQSTVEAKQIVDLKAIANDLALSVIQANSELNIYRDLLGNKCKGEIDKKGLKQLTSALKDLNDILVDKDDNNQNSQSLADAIQTAYQSKVGDMQC